VQDVGAVLLDHLVRRDDVAERLRHLLGVLVEDEPVRQHLAVRRLAGGRDRGDQRTSNQPAMLIHRFDVEIGRPPEAAFVQHRVVRAPGVEPHVENVVVAVNAVLPHWQV
jgi:hypothetical protein